MTDAGAAPPKVKSSTSKAVEPSDGKKKFEVKKVRHAIGYSKVKTTDTYIVERCSFVGMGHRSRQLRHLQKPHYGSLHRLSSQPSLSYLRRVHRCLGYLQRTYHPLSNLSLAI